jgi:hypothetical protein
VAIISALLAVDHRAPVVEQVARVPADAGPSGGIGAFTSKSPRAIIVFLRSSPIDQLIMFAL